MDNGIGTHPGHNPNVTDVSPGLLSLDQADNPHLAYALHYLTIGLSPIPLCPSNCTGHPPSHTHAPHRAGKVPLLSDWTRFATSRATERQVRGWWTKWPDANVGLALGGIGGVGAWDIDDEEGMAEFLKLMDGPIPPTLRFRTGGGGERIFFRWPDGEKVPTRHRGTEGKPLSFLGHGAQTAAPPSVHHTGALYVWPDGCPVSLAGIVPAPDWMRSVLTQKAGGTRRTGGGTVSADVAGSTSGGVIDRAIKYLTRCQPAVTGEGGDRQTYKVCCKLVGMFKLPVADALRLLMLHYNPRCSPEWDESNLLRKLTMATADHHEIDGGSGSNRQYASAIPSRVLHNLDQPSDSCDHGRAGYDDETPDVGTDAQVQPVPASARSTTGQTPTSRKNVQAAIRDAAHSPMPGRLASALVARRIDWLLPPYIPRGMLSMVAGHPNTGKSTLAAHLVSKARRTVLLPGSEEDPDRVLLPRLKANGVNLENVLLLEEGDWTLPHAEDRLADVVSRFGAELLLADPIDSYMDEGLSENDGQHVRGFLEAFQRVGKKTGAAVVGIRHPGKDPTNVMVGSRAWRAVPRSVVELLTDPGPPRQCIIRPYKDSLGQDAPARYFELIRDGQAPPVFTIGDLVDAETVDMARTVADRHERSKIDRALELIPMLLAGEPLDSKTVYEIAEREKLNDKVMDRAAARLGVVRQREGKGKNHKCLWSLPSTPREGAA